jgi:hypothetical protein
MYNNREPSFSKCVKMIEAMGYKVTIEVNNEPDNEV